MIGKMGERIRAARKAEGLNQVQLAKKAGIAQSTLSALERGENRGTRELMALANALRRRPQWLQYGTGPQMLSEGDWPFSTPRRDYEALPAKAKALIDEYIADRVELEAAHARKSPGRAA